MTLKDQQTAPKTPFTLHSPAGELHCLDVLRFLPGKRIVLRATLNDQNVIAKCFFGRRAARDRLRELRGIQGFQQANVATPELIAEGCADDKHFVITRELQGAISFDKYWQQPLTDDERRYYLTKIANTIGHLHTTGIEQKDFHLDNLLLLDKQLYLIDGGCVEVVNSPHSSAEAINNIALFQAVLFPKYDRFLADVWQAYSQAAPKLAESSTLTDFSRTVQKQRKWRERFVQKALRNCTRFRVEKSWHHFLAIDKALDTPALRALLNDPEQAIANGKVIKKGTTNTVAIVTLANGEQVLIKRFQSTKNIVHRYLRGLRESRARTCWLNGFLLEMLGIATPQPYALLEQRFGPLVTCSYVINRYHQPLQGSPPQAMDWFMRSPLPEGYEQIAEQIGELLGSLQRALIYHGDLKGNNILLVEGQPMLIDLDAMTSYQNRSKFREANKKDINRFAKNWVALPEAAAVFAPIIEKLNTNRDTL